MMTTICLQIGNSDDKLSQKSWRDFLIEVGGVLEIYSELHFAGFSNPVAPWQNAAYVFNATEEMTAHLKDRIKKISLKYSQDSIAWLEGEIEFV